MVQDAFDRVTTNITKMQNEQQKLLEVTQKPPGLTQAYVVEASGAANPGYFNLLDDSALGELSELLIESPPSGPDAVKGVITSVLTSAAEREADETAAKAEPIQYQPASQQASTTAAFPNATIELSSPNTLDGKTRQSLAVRFMLLSAAFGAIAIALLVISDQDKDPGSGVSLSVVVSIIAVVAAGLIASGYGTVRATTSTGSSAAPGTRADDEA